VAVYVIVQLTVHDRERYDRYAERFLPTIAPYGGRVLAAQDSPQVLEGTWPHERVVLLSFADRDAFTSWAESPEYREIVGDRLAATEGPVLLVDGFA
jgi:uncharacterized protein (DUF1330 family)